MKKNEMLRKKAVLFLSACVYALLYALGSQIDEAGTAAGLETLKRFALAFPVSLAVLHLLMERVLPRLGTKKPSETGGGGWRFAAGVFVWLLGCYGVMFLIHYPGSFMYDTQRQVFQIARGEYEMFHPLAHTLLIRACLSLCDVLGSFEKCAAVYSVVQIALFAACFAQVCAAVRRMYGRRAAWISALFFGLYPSHMAFASNCTKDGLFSAFFALYFALCFEAALHGGLTRRRWALCLAAGTLACLFRNNMIYALIVWMLLLFALGRKYVRLAVCALAAAVLCTVVNTGLQRATDAADGSRIEMLSVPIQQLARARLERPDCFSQEEKDLMDLVFADAKYGSEVPQYMLYEPTLADPVKNHLSEELVLAHFGDLASMWAGVGLKCPGVYLDAFLNLALPSLYPYSRYKVAQPYIETGLQPGVVTAPFGQPPMSQPGRFEAVRSWMYEHIYSTGADDIPVIRYLFNTGSVFWALLLLMLCALYMGRGTHLVMFLLPALLWGTFLLGPVMQGRYLYPFVCVFPLFVCGMKPENGTGHNRTKEDAHCAI